MDRVHPAKPSKSKSHLFAGALLSVARPSVPMNRWLRELQLEIGSDVLNRSGEPLHSVVLYSINSYSHDQHSLLQAGDSSSGNEPPPNIPSAHTFRPIEIMTR